METRELYQQKYEAQVHEWKARLDVLKAKSEKATAQAKLDVKPHLDAMRAKYDTAKARITKLAQTTDDKWDAVVADVDSGWAELKAAAEGVHDALKKHHKL